MLATSNTSLLGAAAVCGTQGGQRTRLLLAFCSASELVLNPIRGHVGCWQRHLTCVTQAAGLQVGKYLQARIFHSSEIHTVCASAVSWLLLWLPVRCFLIFLVGSKLGTYGCVMEDVQPVHFWRR